VQQKHCLCNQPDVSLHIQAAALNTPDKASTPDTATAAEQRLHQYTNNQSCYLLEKHKVVYKDATCPSDQSVNAPYL
jgi:hypothetical protein